MDRELRHKMSASVKQVNEDGSVRFRLTSKRVDRDGEVIIPDGINLDNFKNNPVVLFGHGWNQQQGNIPIGKIKPESLKVTSTYLDGDVLFDEDGEDKFAKMIADKVRRGFLNSGSIGFLPTVLGQEPVLPKQTGVTIKESELMEFSIATIPSNVDSLASREFTEFRQQCKSFIDKPEQFDEILMEYYKENNDKEAINELIIQKDFDVFRKNKLDEITETVIKESKEITEKAGRVLSSKNRTLVKNVVDNMEPLLDKLKVLLEATDPENEEGKQVNIDETTEKTDIDTMVLKQILEINKFAKLYSDISKIKDLL